MPYRVLIVDDDKAIAQLTAIWLGAAGYAINVAYHGDEALEIARRVKPDVGVLDIRMPGRDGFEVSAEMRADPDLIDVPIIYLSASVQESARHEAIAAGASAFLPKPFVADHIVRAVRRAIENRERQMEGLAS